MRSYLYHGLALLAPDGSQVFGMDLPGDMSAPKTTTEALVASGSYSVTCTTYCGAGHSYMQLMDAIQVS